MWNKSRRRGGSRVRAAAALAFVALLGVACGSSWREFKSDAGNFRVEFPGGTPTERQESDGVHNVRIVHAVIDTTIAYAVAWYDIPKGAKPPAIILAEAQAKTLRDLKAGIETSKEITLGDRPDGAPGRAFTARTANGIYVSIRYYAVGTEPMRVYRLIAAVPDLGKADADLRRFFGSFQLRKRTP